MNRLFNSVREIKLRVLLLLNDTLVAPLSEDMILAMDFIAVYGKDFELSEHNLHGDNSYKYSELPSRKEVISKSIKELFLDGMIDVDTSKGYRYQINDSGTNYISELDNEYADEYKENIYAFFEKYREYSAGQLLRLIQEKSIVSVKEDN